MQKRASLTTLMVVTLCVLVVQFLNKKHKMSSCLILFPCILTFCNFSMNKKEGEGDRVMEGQDWLIAVGQVANLSSLKWNLRWEPFCHKIVSQYFADIARGESKVEEQSPRSFIDKPERELVILWFKKMRMHSIFYNSHFVLQYQHGCNVYDEFRSKMS